MTRSAAALDAGRLEARLAEMADARGVPGASLAVLSGDRVVSVAIGVVSVETQVAATPDTVFEIGSITKPYTAAAAMRLVEGGRISLDAPLRDALPEFRVLDRVATEQVTLRDLVTHTSGIAGDHFDDTGRGDDALERYLALAAGFGQDAPCGATMSYCNAGYSILGRLIERLTGVVWDDAMRELLLDPLGLERTRTLVEDILGMRIAMGHEPDDDGSLRHAARPDGRSVGPAGGIWSTAEEVLGFARLFMDGGKAPDGRQLLDPETIAAMLEPQVAVPDPYLLGTPHWGLGWMLHGWARGAFGHGGNGHGHSSVLAVAPDQRVAVALLSNGGDASPLTDDVLRALLPELAGAQVPDWPQPVDEPAADVEPWLGRYERFGVSFELESEDGALLGRLNQDGGEQQDFPVRPTGEAGTVLAALLPRFHDRWVPLVFYEVAGERYLHFGARAHRRVP